MLDAVHTDDASVTALFMKEKLDLILDNLTFNGKKQRKDSGSKQKLQPPSLELGRGSWLLANL
ncbi:hypothetical protein V8C86DRAFT_3103023 [Haematococcus lacustris]